jgi:hypothetical protein
MAKAHRKIRNRDNSRQCWNSEIKWAAKRAAYMEKSRCTGWVRRRSSRFIESNPIGPSMRVLIACSEFTSGWTCGLRSPHRSRPAPRPGLLCQGREPRSRARRRTHLQVTEDYFVLLDKHPETWHFCFTSWVSVPLTPNLHLRAKSLKQWEGYTWISDTKNLQLLYGPRIPSALGSRGSSQT